VAALGENIVPRTPERLDDGAFSSASRGATARHAAAWPHARSTPGSRATTPRVRTPTDEAIRALRIDVETFVTSCERIVEETTTPSDT
jgi:uncharacterized protein (DUF849 family)